MNQKACIDHEPPLIFNFNQETKVSHHVSQVLCMTGAWCLKTLQKYNLFKEMFKQCGFKCTFCCAVLNVLREVVPVPYHSWKVALGIQIFVSCLPYVECGIHHSRWSSHCYIQVVRNLQSCFPNFFSLKEIKAMVFSSAFQGGPT